MESSEAAPATFRITDRHWKTMQIIGGLLLLLGIMGYAGYALQGSAPNAEEATDFAWMTVGGFWTWVIAKTARWRNRD